MASAMDVDPEEVEMPTSSSSKGEKKRFEVKKVRLCLNCLQILLNNSFSSGMQSLFGLGVSSLHTPNR